MVKDRQIGAVILAAGASTRLGRPKQTLQLAGETLLDRAVRVALEAGLSQIVVVLGAFAEEIRGTCRLTGCKLVVNYAWEDGIAASIRVGISELKAVRGAIMMTCDMPFVTAAHLTELTTREKVTASRYAGGAGVPAFFPVASFPDLVQLHGPAGAKALLSSAKTIDLHEGEFDIDSQEDLDRMRALGFDLH